MKLGNRKKDSESSPALDSDALGSAVAKKPPLWTHDFVVIATVNLLLFSGFQMLPSLLPLYVGSLGGADWVMGAATGLSMITALFFRPIAGILIDRFGTRGLIFGGIAALVLCTASYAFLPTIGLILVIRFISGIPWALANTATHTTAANLVPRSRYAEGMGWYGQSMSMALLIGPWLSVTMFRNINGQLSILVSAALFALSLTVAIVGKVKKRSTEEQTFAKPTLRTSLQAALSRFQEKRHIKLREFVSVNAQEKLQVDSCEQSSTKNRKESQAQLQKEPQKRSRKFSLSSLVEKRALLSMLLMLGTTSCYGVMQAFMPTMTMERGIENLEMYFVVWGLVLFVARPAYGVWVDKKGLVAPTVFGLSLVTIAVPILAFSYNLPMLLLAAALQSAGQNACYTTLQAMAVASVEPEKRGAAMATFLMGFDLGIGSGSILSGFLAAWVGYLGGFLIVGLFPAFALAYFVIKGRKQAQSSWDSFVRVSPHE